MLVDDDDYFCHCERCNAKCFLGDFVTPHFWPLVDYLWAGVNRPNLGEFCLKCADEIAPHLYALRDIDYLKSFTNKLQKAINEKRKQSN